MPRPKSESDKKHGDELESLIERTDSSPQQDAESDDDEGEDDEE